METGQRTKLESLLQPGVIWRGHDRQTSMESVVATGVAGLDERIGGGWPKGALSEILADGPAGLSLLVPALARLSKKKRWLTWVNPPHVPYAPALAARKIDTSHVLLVGNGDHKQGLWAAEQAMRSGLCAAVLLWSGGITPPQVRRLQLAAEKGDCMGVLFRCRNEARQASPAALRLQVSADDEGLLLRVLKRRGGWGGASLKVNG